MISTLAKFSVYCVQQGCPMCGPRAACGKLEGFARLFFYCRILLFHTQKKTFGLAYTLGTTQQNSAVERGRSDFSSGLAGCELDATGIRSTVYTSHKNNCPQNEVAPS